MQGIERFLALVPAQTRQRGRNYFTAGNVLELKCVEPDYLYTAVVRGGADYEVGLEFADRVWVSKCSCPMHYDCKHTVAAMLELQRRAMPDAPPPDTSSSKPQARSAEQDHPSSQCCGCVSSPEAFALRLITDAVETSWLA